MRVIVLGGGVIGVTTAWYLREHGFQVTVLDRQPAPALETSFANGGQISVSHTEPWANPATLARVIHWIGQSNAPLWFRPSLDWQQWRWAMAFLWECRPHRAAQNGYHLLRLAEYSRHQLGILRQALGIAYDYSPSGILHFYTQERELRRAEASSRWMRSLGCDRQILSRDGVLEREPALYAIRDELVGGDFTATDEVGDAHRFSLELAQRAIHRGVQFRWNTQITRLLHTAQYIQGVEVIDAHGTYQELSADCYVVALANQSRDLLQPLGISMNIYPAKGYSATLKIVAPERAPRASITDDEHKMVFSRLGEHLRVAGTAEFGYADRILHPVRCQALVQRAREIFPELCHYDRPQYWSGLRPSTPSNVPYVGATRYPNLYVNTGHGTLGWTLACGSGRAIADIVATKVPEVDFCFTQK